MEKKSYAHKIEGNPDFGFLSVQVPANETLRVEASAMASMDSHVQMKTKLKGGFARFLTSESLFINEFTPHGAPGEVCVAPGPQGEIQHVRLENTAVYLAASSFVASSMGVKTETKFQGLVKGFFSGSGLFLIKCSGVGDLWFNTFGAIFEVDVQNDCVVDTGHIVGFTEGLTYDISKIGGYKSLFFSGEGFVARFKGQGKVWVQTKQPLSFVSWAHFFRRVKSKD